MRALRAPARDEVMELYRGVGLQCTGRQVRSGAVLYHLLHAAVEQVRARLAAPARVLGSAGARRPVRTARTLRVMRLFALGSRLLKAARYLIALNLLRRVVHAKREAVHTGDSVTLRGSVSPTEFARASRPGHWRSARAPLSRPPLHT